MLNFVKYMFFIGFGVPVACCEGRVAGCVVWVSRFVLRVLRFGLWSRMASVGGAWRIWCKDAGR
jgi:hypothetical protein